MSFRLKIILGVALIELVLLILLIVQSLALVRDSSQRGVTERAHAAVNIVATLARDGVLQPDQPGLQSFADDLVRQSEVHRVRILAGDQVLASATAPGVSQLTGD